MVLGGEGPDTVQAGHRDQRGAHRRHDPCCDGRDGRRPAGIGPDPAPAEQAQGSPEARGPQRSGQPGQPATGGRGRAGGGPLQYRLPQPGRQLGQRQQARQHLGPQRAVPAARADLAVLEVPGRQPSRLHGQPPVPVGQHGGEFRA